MNDTNKCSKTKKEVVMKRARFFSAFIVLIALLTSIFTTTVYAAPAAPKNLKAAVLGSSSVKLTWTAVTGTAKYQVYKGTSTTSMELAATVTTAYATITALMPSTTYYFKVRALTSSGAAGSFCTAISDGFLSGGESMPFV
jgi:hypothetical protein